THQIRVHLAAVGHPILGDATYAGARGLAVAAPRVMLHAHRVAFPHPVTGATMEVEAPLPEDFRALLLAVDAAPPAV
ncbi:MAG: RluA family pseudouridine synthase, partial [Planctomycetota bacterium]